MTPCANGCGRQPDERANPVARCWTASQCEPVNKGAGARGYDGAKKLCGRKRHLLVDTLGLVLLVMVTAADVPDRD